MERAMELPDMDRRNCATCGRDCDECWPTRVEKCMTGGGAWIPREEFATMEEAEAYMSRLGLAGYIAWEEGQTVRLAKDA